MKNSPKRIAAPALAAKAFLLLLSAPAVWAVDVPRYTMHEIVLTSAKPYGNPFANVSVSVKFVHQPTNTSYTAYAFHDGGNTWRVRFTPPLQGNWTYRTTATDATNSGLHDRTGSFTCVNSSEKGFVRVDPAQPLYFSFSNGQPFYGIGDTAYYMVTGISDNQRANYLTARQNKNFNFIRFFASGSPLSFHASLTNAQAWPWGGTPPTNPDYTKFNPQFFRRLETVLSELDARNMYAEIILTSYYPNAPFRTPEFTSAHEDAWVKYLVSRLAAYPTVFLWTVTNEYDIYPSGAYQTFTSADNDWAKRIGGLIHQYDPQKHPTTVHPWEAPQMSNPPLDIYPRFGSAAQIDVLTQQHWGSYAWDAAQNCNDGSADGIDDAIRRDRIDKPVLNLENGYEWLSNYPRPPQSFACTSKARRAAWRTFMGGGASYAAGFAGTWIGKDPYDFKGIVGLRFEIRDMGLADDLSHYAAFIPTTDFRNMDPANNLTNANNLCLAKPGQMYVLYAPSGGTVPLNLAGVSGTFKVERFNPRTGGVPTTLANAAGNGTASFISPDNTDWVYRLEKITDTQAPTVPAGLTATGASADQINLSWTPSTDNVGVTGYRVERCQGASCTAFTQIAAPTGASYNDTGLSAATTYRYRVRAADAAGNLSGYSGIASATTQAPPPVSPAKPRGLRIQ